ncbi:hypothetical protein [Gemmata massiliana]|uniref:hypothetical protein n=1 Tax=Gemmata massiliana TaxID=1210884 RepID=UPI001E5E2C55|nr:hypothetical protein [Gemmata massiliana]
MVARLPGSVVTAPGKSVVATWGAPELWGALRDLGVDLLHTGPVERARGVQGTEYTPTTDRWFDHVSLDLDPALGTAEEYAKLVAVAAAQSRDRRRPRSAAHRVGAGLPPSTARVQGLPRHVHNGRGAAGRLVLAPARGGAGGHRAGPAPEGRGTGPEGYIPGLINSNDAAPEANC